MDPSKLNIVLSKNDPLQTPLSRATTSSSSGNTSSDIELSPPFVVSQELSKTYYRGLPSEPLLIATTRTDPINFPSGLEAYPILKELRALGNHPLSNVWDHGLAMKIRSTLNDLVVNWTSIDALRIAETDKPSGSYAVVWVGIQSGSLSFKDGSDVAYRCQTLIGTYNIQDCFVEIRESSIMRQAGVRFLDPVPVNDPTFMARDPYTATLSIPISVKNSPFEGTGGFYLSAGGDDKNIYLVTARHVVLPMDKGNKTYTQKNSSQARHDVVVLGKSALKMSLDGISEEIKHSEQAVTDSRELLQLFEGSDESMSARPALVLQQQLETARESVKELNDLKEHIDISWTSDDNRVFGELVWAPPITFSTKPDRYTLDLAVIKIDKGKLDNKNYCGNTINIGNKYRHKEFMAKVYPHPSNSPSFKFPLDRLVLLRDQVPRKDITNPPMFGANGDPCLVVFKHGATTGITIGMANSVASFSRDNVNGEFEESREWPVVSADKAGPFSKIGDSGACVADARGRVGGIITGGCGQNLSNAADVTYVTPISFIMQVLHDSEHFKNAHLNPSIA